MEPTTDNKKTIDLDKLVLRNGSHDRRTLKTVCLMEAVAWFAGEKHSDRPECTDVALAAFGRAFNDRLRDDERQMLKPLIPTLVGTRGSLALTKRRAFHLVDRYLRSIIPAFLRELPNKPRPDLAEQLEGQPPVIDRESAERARDLARSIRKELQASAPPFNSAAAAAAYAAAYAYAAADAYAYAAAADADADAYAADADADADAYAYAADADADADADAYAAALKDLRARTIARSLESFKEAIAMTETAGQ